VRERASQLLLLYSSPSPHFVVSSSAWPALRSFFHNCSRCFLENLVRPKTWFVPKLGSPDNWSGTFLLPECSSGLRKYPPTLYDFTARCCHSDSVFRWLMALWLHRHFRHICVLSPTVLVPWRFPCARRAHRILHCLVPCRAHRCVRIMPHATITIPSQLSPLIGNRLQHRRRVTARVVLTGLHITQLLRTRAARVASRDHAPVLNLGGGKSTLARILFRCTMRRYL
jgi:hypothetical protein